VTESLQNALVTVAAALALAWLLVDRIRRRKAKDKCDTCALAQSARSRRAPR
jgi:hypothetical protein